MNQYKGIKTPRRAAPLCVALLAAGWMAAAQGAEEYLLTVTRPGLLHVVDMRTNTLERSCRVPGAFGSGAMALAPDGRTAFVLSNMWEDVYGIDIKTCEVVFAARQSNRDIKVKSIQSVAVSADGKELYTVQNRVRQHPDRLEALAPQLAVFDIADGLEAKPVRTFPVNRRITKIAATHTGEVILGGADVEAIDVRTGATRIVTPLASWDRGPLWAPPDAFAMHSQGEHLNEYIMPYVTAKFTDERADMETAEWWWGMSRVNLETAAVEAMETVPFEFIVFTFVTDPNNRDILYGAFNQLSKHDIGAKQTVAVEPLARTYYAINISGDGKTLYVGGAASDISVHDSATLKKVGSIELPGDMSTADLRVARIE
ncbi:MAG TPA: quinohemoprotein amine dehydrogenase subunit beta [Rhodocyclaceae bacterium]|nr:quinohemoprotein amine dehydrogenase subunit beta [Rhodocyclaceae bacterium]